MKGFHGVGQLNIETDHIFYLTNGHERLTSVLSSDLNPAGKKLLKQLPPDGSGLEVEISISPPGGSKLPEWSAEKSHA